MINTRVFSPINEIIKDARKGKMFILVDDKDRENEGDLIIPGSKCNSKSINFMAKHGRGLICLALSKAQIDKLKLLKFSPNSLMKKNIKVKKDGKVRNGFEVLKFLDPTPSSFKDFFNINISQKLLTKIFFDSKYEVFYEREKKSYDQLNKNKNMNLTNIDFSQIPSLSKEILEKLNKHKPENLNDAGKISGITPSALFQIVKHKKVKGTKIA